MRQKKTRALEATQEALAMDYLKFLPLISLAYVCIHVLLFGLSSKNRKFFKLPPGPPSFPIIGNILQLGTTKFHQAVTNLSKTYGPIMTVKIGTITAVVISSPTITKEALQKNDQAFSGRFTPESVQAFSHHKSSVVFLPASAKWRALRKALATKMFSPLMLDSTEALRQKKLQELVDYLQETCRKGEAIDIGQTAFITVLNSVSNTLFSIDLASYSSDSSKNFRDVISSLLVQASKPNIADYFPILGRFDPQGARRRMKNYCQKLLIVIDSIIEERIQKVDYMGGSKDVLDSFLNLIQEKNSELTRHDVSHLFLDLFIAGVDTASGTVEWAMAELLHNPEKLMKTEKELQQFFSKDEVPKDSDIAKLPYLQAVVKEALRLHPPLPIPVRKSVSEVDLCGFTVPKDVAVLINIWGMARDSSIWSDPNSFIPERFLEGEVDFSGKDFVYIPFGAGRRMCPGVPLAHRLVPTMLASFLYHCDWKLANGEKPEDMDMSEKYGITLHKVKPLMAIPIKE